MENNVLPMKTNQVWDCFWMMNCAMNLVPSEENKGVCWKHGDSGDEKGKNESRQSNRKSLWLHNIKFIRQLSVTPTFMSSNIKCWHVSTALHGPEARFHSLQTREARNAPCETKGRCLICLHFKLWINPINLWGKWVQNEPRLRPRAVSALSGGACTSILDIPLIF